MKKVNFVSALQYALRKHVSLESEASEPELQEYEVSKKESGVLNPQQFLDKYSVQSFSYVGVKLSYDTFEVQDGVENYTTKSQQFQRTNVNSNNVVQVLRDFKSEVESFSNVENFPSTFSLTFQWTPKGSPNEQHNLSVSVQKKNSTYTVRSVTSYSVGISPSNEESVNTVKRFIKSNKRYLKNSPFRLLASVLVYNDWKYGWDVELMQSNLQSREKRFKNSE